GQAQPSGAAAINAAVLYAEQGCATCHGRNGKPVLKQSPDFTDPAWQKKKGDDELFLAIKNGKKPLMQGYGAKLSDEQIRVLVAHTRSFAKQ
ncbi:MAG TPA: c-type cytochrome, partial [Blastocatellia bacterium]|nr:c-type cytochrome [Blastocatellia bacterium]